MGQAPWFKFFSADYMSSPFVQSLEPEQELWYVRLIIASAIHSPRGCLPLANGKLWRIAKAPSEEHFTLHASSILSKFERDDAAGVYRVPKVATQQLHTPDSLSVKRSEAGKRGAAKRWQSATATDGNLPSEAMANTKQKIADSDSDSDSDQEKTPSVADAMVTGDSDSVDPRHGPVRALIQQLHLKQFRVTCPWDGSEGKVLDRLLSANPSWTEAQILEMARNRFASEGIASDRPRKWLSNIGSYAAGPQDRFNKLKGVTNENGNGNGNGKRFANKAELAVDTALANCAAAKRAVGLDH
jgi:hypothetical protein